MYLPSQGEPPSSIALETVQSVKRRNVYSYGIRYTWEYCKLRLPAGRRANIRPAPPNVPMRHSTTTSLSVAPDLAPVNLHVCIDRMHFARAEIACQRTGTADARYTKLPYTSIQSRAVPVLGCP